jgi:cytosine/adenosine deaminase-related metal-dependent hydrolase
MEFVSGEILTEDGFKKGYLGFEKKQILETEKGNPAKKPICKGIIIPSFVNAHTHIGDSFITNKNIKIPKNVEELVAPPNGLKHRLLKEATDDEIIDGMEESISFMIKSGTNHFCDFRENGILGTSQLKTALEYWKISATILSRPDELIYDKNEVDLLLKNSDGIGLSAISDWEYSELKKVSDHTKKKQKIFAIHASERIREDIDLILDLKPDFLVHMIKATKSDLERVKDNNIPIVLCPRSNVFYGLKADFELFKEVGIELMLGTDNAMISSPNVLDELLYLKSQTKVFPFEELLRMVTMRPRKVLNLGPNILGPNSPANFVVLDKKYLKPLYISANK